jgi:hypothetical protein
MIRQELRHSGSFWSFLFVGRIGSGRMRSAAGMLVRWSPALCQLPAGAARRPRRSTRRVSPSIRFLLRSRRMQKACDTTIGALSRQKSLFWCRRHPEQRHAAGTKSAPGPRAFQDVRCRHHSHDLHRSRACCFSSTAAPGTGTRWTRSAKGSLSMIFIDRGKTHQTRTASGRNGRWRAGQTSGVTHPRGRSDPPRATESGPLHLGH